MTQAQIRQLSILSFVKALGATHGYPPTRRQISKATSIPLSVLHYHIKKLSNRGMLAFAPGKYRAIWAIGNTLDTTAIIKGKRQRVRIWLP